LLLGRVTYEGMAAFWPNRPGGTLMVDNSTLIKGSEFAEQSAERVRQWRQDNTDWKVTR
jgi:hypothetical protein